MNSHLFSSPSTVSTPLLLEGQHSIHDGSTQPQIRQSASGRAMAHHVVRDSTEVRPAVPTKCSRTYLVLKLPPYPPPPSTLAAATSTHSGLNVARSSVPDDQPSSNGNDAVLPAAIAVAAFVVTTLVVLRLVRASRTRRRAIAARGQLDEPEPPRMWEVCLSAPRGHTGKWSDLMVRAPPTVTGSLHSPLTLTQMLVYSLLQWTTIRRSLPSHPTLTKNILPIPLLVNLTGTGFGALAALFLL